MVSALQARISGLLRFAIDNLDMQLGKAVS